VDFLVAEIFYGLGDIVVFVFRFIGSVVLSVYVEAEDVVLLCDERLLGLGVGWRNGTIDVVEELRASPAPQARSWECWCVGV